MKAVSPECGVTAERLDGYISELAVHGRNAGGGIDRAVYTPAWRAARRQLADWMNSAGLQVRDDAVGNLFGRLPGRDVEGPVILTGSHIDTVPNGGAFDGALGVHAGLVALEILERTYGAPERSIEVVAICEEESSRFLTGYWGSRAMNGLIDPQDLESIVDETGVTIGEAMRECGLDPSCIDSAGRTDIAAFLELHIEQGPELEERGLDVGLVQAITGQLRATVRVTGHPDHAGTMPMDRRRDAAAGAAEMELEIERLSATLGRPAVTTVGRIEVLPGASNVVPGEVEFTVDMRHPDVETFHRMRDQIAEICHRVGHRRGLTIDYRVAFELDPQPMDEALRGALVESAQRLGLAFTDLTSGAGHDSQLMAKHVPTAMIFVPSRGGRSHSPDEFTPVEQIVPGVRLLIETLHTLAYR